MSCVSGFMKTLKLSDILLCCRTDKPLPSVTSILFILSFVFLGIYALCYRMIQGNLFLLDSACPIYKLYTEHTQTCPSVLASEHPPSSKHRDKLFLVKEKRQYHK